jgi:hypothetical protein
MHTTCNSDILGLEGWVLQGGLGTQKEQVGYRS